eukprot:367784_1
MSCNTSYRPNDNGQQIETLVQNINPKINAISEQTSSLISSHNKHIISLLNINYNTSEQKHLYLSNIFDDNYIDEKSNSFDNKNVDTEINEFTEEEIFEMIRNINDPEHPLTLEQLNVVNLDNIHIDLNNKNKVLITYTPTIPHCSMATLIGLSIQVKLLRSLPSRFKVKVKITPNTHQSEKEINKQLNDKERVAAALENYSLIKVVNQCIKTSLS